MTAARIGRSCFWRNGRPPTLASRVLHLSRNFGHQIAATAGLDHATGDAVVLLDADLQDPLSVIHQMIDRYCDGYDVVYGQRESRAGESAYKRFTAWAFYRIMRTLVYRQLPPDVGDFRLISRPCLDAVKPDAGDAPVFAGHGGLGRISADCCPLPPAAARCRGYEVSAAKDAGLFLDRGDVVFDLAAAPQHDLRRDRGNDRNRRRNPCACWRHFLGWYTVPGWTSLTVLVSLIGSALLMSIGILGEYVAKLYEQSKGRPLYIVARTFGVRSRDSGQIREWDAAIASEMTPFDRLSSSYEELLRDPLRDRFTGSGVGILPSPQKRLDSAILPPPRSDDIRSSLSWTWVRKRRAARSAPTGFQASRRVRCFRRNDAADRPGSKLEFKKTLCKFHLATPNSIW